jgi:HK97 family phage prohead protease
VKTKSFTIEAKALDEAGEGRFTGYASVFDNVDSYGDMVIAGAFADSLKTFGSKGDGIPLLWRHRTDDPFMNLGATLEAKEDARGLWVDCQIDLETAAGKQTHKLLKQGRVGQMSFAYDIVEAGWIERKPEDGGSYYELRKLDIREVSVVQFGANSETEILAVKTAVDLFAADVKAGRKLSTENEDEIRDAYKALGDILTPDSEEAPADSVKADVEPDAKATESTGTTARALAVNTLTQSL